MFLIISLILSQMISINKEISKQQSELDTVLQLRQDAVCPYCKQKLDQQHILELENKFLQRKDFWRINLVKWKRSYKRIKIRKMSF